MRRPDSWHTAQATVTVAVATAFIYIIVSTFRLDAWAAAAAGGFAPATVGGPLDAQPVPWLLTPLTAALLHVSLLHLAFNLLILLFCGRSVEGALGPTNLLVLYMVGAYAAAAGQYAAAPASYVIMVGASGAISAVVGAYAMLFGRNRVRVASHRWAVWLNAAWLLAAWMALQVGMGFVFGGGGNLLPGALGQIAGFITGLALARPLLLWRYRHA